MAKSKADADKSPDVTEATAGNVDQIRDILFGTQMRDYETRFRALEKHVDAEAKRIRDDLTASLSDSRKTLQADIKKLTDSMGSARNDLASQVADMDQRVSGEASQMQSDIQDAVGDLKRMLDERASHLEDMLERQGKELHSDKAGREELADLLTMTAKRLLGDGGDR